MVFKSGAFQLDPNMTPDQVANKRAMIAALLPKFGSAKYVGEGIGQLATGVMAGRQGRRLDEIEGKGTASANSLFERIFGTANSAQSPAVQGPLSVLGMTPDQGGGQSTPQDPNSPSALGDDAMAALGKPAQRGYLESLIGTESGGNWAAQNGETGAGGQKGHFGRVQFGKARLQEAMNAGVIPQGTTPEQFMASPDLQMAAENWHFGDLENRLGDLVGREVNGRVMDMGALVAMGHLGGAGGARKYVESGGEYNPSDSFGTSLSDYAATHGGKGNATPAGTAATAPTSAPTIPINELYMALQNPWLSGEQKGLITSMIQEQQQASDPMRQLELQKAQLELERLQNPTAQMPEELTTRMLLAQNAGLEQGTPEFQHYLLTGELPEQAGSNVPAGFATLDMQAQAAGYAPGTPEYQQFMRDGGGSGAPAAFIALDLQAKAAGFEQGTPEYQEFMATRGAGFAEGAKVRAGAAAEAEIAAPADIVVADRTLGYIDEVRNHPGKGQGTGMSSYGNWIPGTSGKDFQNRVDQLKSGAFLSAIDEMRGMGSLSNAEGQTATAAITRMDTATSEEEFNAALDDYERIVKLGKDRAEKRLKAPADGASKATGDFSKMGIAEIGQVDIGSLTPEQMDALEARMTELGL